MTPYAANRITALSNALGDIQANTKPNPNWAAEYAYALALRGFGWVSAQWLEATQTNHHSAEGRLAPHEWSVWYAAYLWAQLTVKNGHPIEATGFADDVALGNTNL